MICPLCGIERSIVWPYGTKACEGPSRQRLTLRCHVTECGASPHQIQYLEGIKKHRNQIEADWITIAINGVLLKLYYRPDNILFIHVTAI